MLAVCRRLGQQLACTHSKTYATGLYLKEGLVKPRDWQLLADDCIGRWAPPDTAASCIGHSQSHDADRSALCRVQGLRESLVSQQLPPRGVVDTLDDISDTVSCAVTPSSAQAQGKQLRTRCWPLVDRQQTANLPVCLPFLMAVSAQGRAHASSLTSLCPPADMSGVRRSRVLQEHASGCCVASGGAAGLHQTRRCELQT